MESEHSINSNKYAIFKLNLQNVFFFLSYELKINIDKFDNIIPITMLFIL
jgi:hypothetical protein